MRLTSRARRVVSARMRDERGFTMVTVMGALFIIGLLSVAAIAAANGDIRFSRVDQDDKQAYAAAEAGVNDYLAHLASDPDYWTRCAGEDSSRPLGAGHAVNQPLDRGLTGLPARGWRNVQDSNSHYSIELLPASKAIGSKCDTADPAGSMIKDGNLRIRVTGEVKGTNRQERIVATFRRAGFLDFLYFTDLENADPTYLALTTDNIPTQATDSSGNPIAGADDLYEWAGDKCEHHWWGTQAQGEGRREMPTWRGQFQYGGVWQPANSALDLNTTYACGEIMFASDDKIDGPFHSNDDILISGTPEFGRSTKTDKVETSGDGYRGSGTPVFNTPDGKLKTKARRLDLPPSNTALKKQARAAYTYKGPTELRLDGAVMDVTTNGTTTPDVPLPGNGVIYVDNLSPSCIYGFRPRDTEAIDPGCGVVKVSGTYSKDLTIAARDDVIVDNNLTRVSGSNAVLGLVAGNFVRVWHPVDRNQSGCPNKAGSVSDITIEAAILSLKHSFAVDNYDCGVPLGTLTVDGVIAQKHRGIVGQGGSSITHGYVKNYKYDDRLKYRSPPYFLDPIQASWRILRQNQQAD